MPYPDYPCTKCNSWIDPPPGTKNGAKFICPRCDDRVTWFGPDIPDDAVVPPAIKVKATERKKITAGSVVAVMAFMALVGLIFALSTQKTRRERDHAPRKKDPREIYLSWVHSDSTLLATLDLEKLRESEPFAPLLKSLDGNKQQDIVAKYIGYKAREIQVACLELNPEKIMGATLVLRTKPKIDLEILATRLKAAGSGYRNGRETMRYPVDFFPVGPTFAKLETNTLALSFLPERLDAIPPFARDGLQHLNRRISPLVIERIPGNALAWLASQGGKLNLNGFQFPAIEENPLLEIMEKVDSFAIWVEDQGKIMLRSEILCQDLEAARNLEEAISAMGKKNATPVQVASREKWLTLQMELSGENLRNLGDSLPKILKKDR